VIVRTVPFLVLVLSLSAAAAGCGDDGSSGDGPGGRHDTGPMPTPPMHHGVCGGPFDCPTDELCYRIDLTDGRTSNDCTVECTVETDCPAGDACIPYGKVSLCFQRCAVDADCVNSAFGCVTATSIGAGDTLACFPK